VGDGSEAWRQELGRFLRGRRMQKSFADYGFPEGRRRTPGLRREEVALLAGVSPTWYTYLEQGRDIRPSTDVLERIADVLGLSPDEHNYLHVLACGHRPQRQLSEIPPELLRTLEDLVRIQPEPCYVANGAADVLAWNAPAATWYTDFARLPPDRRNLLRWALSAPEAKQRLVDWKAETHDLIGRVRSALARRDASGLGTPGDTVHDLLESNEQALAWWDEQQVTDHVPRVRHLRADDGRIVRFRLLPLFEVLGHDCGVVFHVRMRPDAPTSP